MEVEISNVYLKTDKQQQNELGHGEEDRKPLPTEPLPGPQSAASRHRSQWPAFIARFYWSTAVATHSWVICGRLSVSAVVLKSRHGDHVQILVQILEILVQILALPHAGGVFVDKLAFSLRALIQADYV